MAGNEVDYTAFAKFFQDTMKSAGDSSKASGYLTGIAGNGSTGAVGIDSAWAFKSLNKQSITSINAYFGEQMMGRMFLAEAAAAVALAYHDGDLNQQGAVNDVMLGILNPNGHTGTAQEKYTPPEDGTGADGSDDGSAQDAVPPPALDQDGNIVDAQGNILFNADGTPGNADALAAAGITPGAQGQDATGTSPYLAYINRINASTRAYYSNYTGVSESEIESGNISMISDPDEAENAETPRSTEQMSQAFVDLVRPPEGPVNEDAVTSAPPEEPVNLAGYEPPAPQDDTPPSYPGQPQYQ